MRSPKSSSESGHLLLALMIGLTVMAIFLTVAAQQWSTLERRENEKELIFRGNQYVQAIKKYQMEHGGAYPTNLEILVKPGPRQLRYIRKLFRDPMAPDGKWGILLADPSGKGFINPNAPPADQGVPGLEDLGQGLKSSSNDNGGASGQHGQRKRRQPPPNTGLSSWDTKSEDDKDPDGVASVTAPGQPTGPIVGVVSLYDQEAFRRYHDQENYADWTFSIFDLLDQNQQKPQLGASVPTPGMGIGPGGSQTIYGNGTCSGANCLPGTKGPSGNAQPPRK